MNNVCVIIPMYNHAEMTRKCVDMTLEKAGMGVDILVVDDGSQEPFVYPHERVFVHKLKSNGGFTNATNQGILWCSDKWGYLHMLNNDTEPRDNFIKILHDVMEADSTIGIASSARIHDKKQMGERNLELMGADLIRGYQRMTTETQDLPHVVKAQWVPLCSAMVRHSTIREIGLLDKRMITWCSDNDYCINALFRGWQVVVVPSSRVYHHHQVTTGTKNQDGVSRDQQMLLQKLAGAQYASLMKEMPLDCENNTHGKITFEVYTK
jgi:GT2 family glycosyltransferase